MHRTQRGFIAPEIDSDSAGWWAAVAHHRFTLPKCAACGEWSFPPGPSCPLCGRRGVELAAASGRGTVYSWVVVHRAVDPAFADDVPYTIVAVDLQEGPRIFGRFLEERAPLGGEAVRAAFYDVQDQGLVGFHGGTFPPDSEEVTDALGL